MKKKTHEQFIKQLSEMNPNLIALSEYKGALSPIKVKCKLCGYEWESATANTLISSRKPVRCLNCHDFIPDKNDNDYFSVAYPEFADYLVNKEEGYRYKKKSEVEVDWICPDCGNVVKQIPFEKIANRKHIPCKRCSDGVSFPNKVMYNLLMQLGVEFQTEYSPEWIRPKRYDFFVPSMGIIIEMDGSIGHGGKTFTGDDGTNLLNIDNYKDEMANKHNINVIRIDSKISEIDYLSSNIIKSRLSNIFDFENIDWKRIEKESFSSLQIKTIQLWENKKDIPYIIEEMKLSRITILRYLKKGSKNGMCSYNPKMQQRLSGKKNMHKAYERNRKKVICLETCQVFNSFREANEWLGYNKRSHVIRDYCKGLLQSAGKHPITKEKLHWMYYDEYLKGVA